MSSSTGCAVEGVCPIFISHRMEEVWPADRITVFRDGTYVGTGTRGTLRKADIVRMMIDDLYHHEPRTAGNVMLDVKDLAGEGFEPSTFQLRGGEGVSMSGLVGSGRTELARLAFGADRRAGTVVVKRRSSHPQTCQYGSRTAKLVGVAAADRISGCNVRCDLCSAASRCRFDGVKPARPCRLRDVVVCGRAR